MQMSWLKWLMPVTSDADGPTLRSLRTSPKEERRKETRVGVLSNQGCHHNVKDNTKKHVMPHAQAASTCATMAWEGKGRWEMD
jgi:hypothetical protein